MTSFDVLIVEMDLPRVDFIKLDIDGYEGKVLRGAREVLAKWRPAIVFEISPGMMAAQGDSAADLIALLEGIGYELSYEDGGKIEDLGVLLNRVGDYSINLLAVAR
jgi:hypothetical protein